MPARAALKTCAGRRLATLLGAAGLLLLSAAPTAVLAAEIYGRVTMSDGKAAANKPIVLNGKEVGKTDASGGYRLSLPPGQYALTIGGKGVSVLVPPPGIKQDIRLP
jgi:hypothetical protein